jgi:hypothetical protein
MPQFLSGQALYETIQRKSIETKGTLWVCSPNLGPNAHEVFAQEILRNPPADIRFVVRINESSVKKGEVSPYEVQYIMEHFGNCSIKSMEDFNSNIYIFDDSALMTSAYLAKPEFGGTEVGVTLEGTQLEESKAFLDQNLWQHAKPVSDLKKLKQTWNSTQNKLKKEKPTKVQPRIQLRSWTDEYVNRWYIAVPFQLPSKTERAIRKEMTWPNELAVAGDVGYQTFRELKLGDLAYLVDFKNNRGKVEIESAKIVDKIKVETDQGDLHFAYQANNKYLLEREQFFEMLKNAHINPSRTFETKLSPEQVTQLTNVLMSIKHKRRRKAKSKQTTAHSAS